MPLARRAEGLALPAGPSLSEAKAGDARHEVELTWPGVARDNRKELNAFWGQDHVAFLERLGHVLEAAHLLFLGELDAGS
ncbi:MAG: hypothetical protein VYE73_11265 [Acidobacteriota bacterium]|nr:hypothetical protein [Acidobacteriota bacterium]